MLEVGDDDLVAVLDAAREHDCVARVIGRTGGDALEVAGHAVAVAELRAINEAWLPAYMGEEMSGH